MVFIMPRINNWSNNDPYNAWDYNRIINNEKELNDIAQSLGYPEELIIPTPNYKQIGEFPEYELWSSKHARNIAKYFNLKFGFDELIRGTPNLNQIKNLEYSQAKIYEALYNLKTSPMQKLSFHLGGEKYLSGISKKYWEISGLVEFIVPSPFYENYFRCLVGEYTYPYWQLAYYTSPFLEFCVRTFGLLDTHNSIVSISDDKSEIWKTTLDKYEPYKTNMLNDEHEYYYLIEPSVNFDNAGRYYVTMEIYHTDSDLVYKTKDTLDVKFSVF